VKELANNAEIDDNDSDQEESEGNVLEREVDKMLKEMMANPIARTNVISPVNNEAGGNQVSFKKQNRSILLENDNISNYGDDNAD